MLCRVIICMGIDMALTGEKMAERRKDTKKRVLRDRESQLSDGRYRYTYYEDGRQKSLYSWKLVGSDPLPKGKHECVPLRDQIQQLQRKQAYLRNHGADNITVLDLVKRYVAIKPGVRETTKSGYRTVIRLLEKEPFGQRPIGQVVTSEAKLWLIKLQKEGRHYSSLTTVRGVLRPAFRMAVEDDILLKNPFDFYLADVLINDSVERQALSVNQERQFLEFVKADPHYCRYYDGIFILFKTGLRISEFCGLTLKDVDMKNRMIHVNHQLLRDTKMRKYIETTKTKSGTRDLPMTDEVYLAFKNILSNRKAPKREPIINGYSGFLYYDANKNPMVAMHWEHYFMAIRKKYNKVNRVQMPPVTPHIARHTYCSRMAQSGVSPKTLQYLMGHSEISVTMNVYTHLGFDEAKKELNNLKMMTVGSS